MRILSYNIREGGSGRLGSIARLIRSQNPDVVALIEASDRANAHSLARQLEMHLAFGEANNAAGHIAWMSRLPVLRTENHRHPGLAKTLLEITVRPGDEDVRLFATHLGSRWDTPQPVGEIPIILDILRTAAGEPHVFVGDFNALHPDDPVGVPPNGERKRGDAVDGALRPALRPLLSAGYADCYRELHPKSPGYTYPSSHPWLRLDYIFASPELAGILVACDVMRSEETEIASDHLPICADFWLVAVNRAVAMHEEKSQGDARRRLAKR